MKILKHGKKKNGLTGTCDCGCRVECKESEANEWDPKLGYFTVKCPDCGLNIRLRSKMSRLQEVDNSGD